MRISDWSSDVCSSDLVAGLKDGDAVFFSCDKALAAAKLAGQVRNRLGDELDLLEKNAFRFCWIVDFPMFELDDAGKVEFSHNPFSMPQGGLAALETKDPLDILARSEEHTSELQSLMRSSYAVFCLKKTKSK